MMSKKNLSLASYLLIFLFTSSMLSAQRSGQREGGKSDEGRTEIGARIGGNFGSVGISGIDNSSIDGHTGLLAGILVRQPIDDNLAVTSGIYYKQKGFGFGESFQVIILGLEQNLRASAVTKMNYIEVPLLLNYTFRNVKVIEPYFEIGPAFSYATSAELNTQANVIININISSTDLDLSNDRYNRFEVAGQGVAGIKIPYGIGAFDIGLSYTTAFTDSVNDIVAGIDASIKNRGFGIFAGFNINI